MRIENNKKYVASYNTILLRYNASCCNFYNNIKCHNNIMFTVTWVIFFQWRLWANFCKQGGCYNIQAPKYYTVLMSHFYGLRFKF
jgi:hypothetical protein